MGNTCSRIKIPQMLVVVVAGSKEVLFPHNIHKQGFPGSSAGKEVSCNAEGPGSIPGLGSSPGEEIGYPLQYSGLGNSVACIVCGVTKSQT